MAQQRSVARQSDNESIDYAVHIVIFASARRLRPGYWIGRRCDPARERVQLIELVGHFHIDHFAIQRRDQFAER